MTRSPDVSLSIRPVSRYIQAMAEAFKCAVCEKEEERCDCDKYCCLCQGFHNVRLCQDGQWYCLDCREACELQAQYNTK
ncbi:MAG TPA: hypothetical protein VE825_03435 [Terriglobales bacterium]|jgi:hypothetical protein|nr:hypothetical protein [Terriglobales bacterium]